MTRNLRKTRPALVPAAIMAALVALLAAPLSATMVLQMNLDEMSLRADKIIRGTVVGITPGTVEVGGADLPTVTYEILVSEVLKGDVPVTKDGVQIAEITMLGTLKSAPVNGLERVSKLPELPALAEGGEYLLFTTAPSPLGLSTTVGVGQGCFDVFSHAKVDMAVNRIGNLGLYDGPVAYSELAQNILDALAE